MRKQWLPVMFLCAGALSSHLSAQIGSYAGPGVLSRGAGQIGQRAGQPASLRFGAFVSGFYDDGLVPFRTDASGKLLDLQGQYGVEAGLSAYGAKTWKTSAIGLNYFGNYRYYTTNGYLNGTDQALQLGYSWQKTRRLSFDFREVAGITPRGNNGLSGFVGYSAGDAFNPSTGLLFDNQTTFAQSSMNMNFLASSRTIISVGGQGFTVHRGTSALAGVNGYTLNGSLQRRLSRVLTIGAVYAHTHYDFPGFFGESTADSYSGMLARQFGPYWVLNVQGGMYQVNVEGLRRVNLDPALAALIGTSTGVQAYSTKQNLPIASAGLTRRFKQATLSFDYQRGMIPGNGYFLTSQSESGSSTFTYSGIDRWSLFANAGLAQMSNIGLDLGRYRTINGGGGVTFAATRSWHLNLRFDNRIQNLDNATQFQRNGRRVTFGVIFSPGDVPIALW